MIAQKKQEERKMDQKCEHFMRGGFVVGGYNDCPPAHHYAYFSPDKGERGTFEKPDRRNQGYWRYPNAVAPQRVKAAKEEDVKCPFCNL
jgi:hypothetical protein